MGRPFIFVSALITLSIFAHAAAAQGDRHSRGPNKFNRRGNDFRRGAERALHLSPEDRQAFRRNAERWLQMDPQQQNILRQREQALREQRRREAETVLKDSGLSLDNHARQEFETRYFQERRRIERQLRQEIEAKRQQQLPELKERLKSEFLPRPGSPAATISPATSN